MSQIDCRIYEAVCAFLFDEWDPIGVKDLGAPRDEYDSYAAGLIRLVLSGADVAIAAHKLAELARENMGLSHVEDERDREIATRLIELVHHPRFS